MRMTRIPASVLGLAFLMAALVGCKKPAGTPYPYGQACDESRMNKRVIVEGYLAAYSSTTCKAGGCELMLHEKPKGEQGSSLLQLTIPVGDGDSEMAPMPKRFTEADIKVKTKTGDVGLDKKVRVTATISRTFMAGDYSPEKKALVDKIHCEMVEPTIEAL